MAGVLSVTRYIVDMLTGKAVGTVIAKCPARRRDIFSAGFTHEAFVFLNEVFSHYFWYCPR